MLHAIDGGIAQGVEQQAWGSSFELAALHVFSTSARFGPFARGFPFELFDEPIETVEIISELILGIVHGVAQDADRSVVAALHDDVQKF